MGHFHAVLFLGGLPGDGWDRSNRSLLTGSLVQDSVILNSAEGKRRYLAQDLKFSVLQKSSLQLAMNRFLEVLKMD